MFVTRLENPWRHFAEHYIWTLILNIAGPLAVVAEFMLRDWNILDSEIFGVLLGPAPLLASFFTGWGVSSLLDFLEVNFTRVMRPTALEFAMLFLALPIVMTFVFNLPILVLMQFYRRLLPTIRRALCRRTSIDVRSHDAPSLTLARAVPVYLACAMPVTIGCAIGAYSTLYGWGWGANEMDRYQEAALAAASGLFYSLGPLVLMFLRRDFYLHAVND